MPVWVESGHVKWGVLQFFSIAFFPLSFHSLWLFFCLSIANHSLFPPHTFENTFSFPSYLPKFSLSPSYLPKHFLFPLIPHCHPLYPPHTFKNTPLSPYHNQNPIFNHPFTLLSPRLQQSHPPLLIQSAGPAGRHRGTGGSG